MSRSPKQPTRQLSRPTTALTRGGLGGTMVRRLWPLALGPVVVGGLVWLGEELGWYGEIAGLGIFAVANVLGLAAAIWLTARWLDHADAERRSAAARLRLSEFAVQHAAVATFLVAPDGRILRVNRATSELMGYTPEELCAMNVCDVAVGLSREAWAARWRELRERGRLAFEARNRRKDGRVFPVDVELNFLEFEGREYNFAYVHDISERQRTAALLAGQRDLLREIATGRPLAETLDKLVRFAEAEAEGMWCSVLLFDEESQTLRHGAAPSLPEGYNRLIDGVGIGPSVGSCGTAAFRREPVIVADIATDPLWADYRPLAAQYELAACWSTPVFGSDARVLGTFAMYYREARRPAPEHLHLIDVITQTASIAIERAQAEEKIHALTAGLERRVGERTRELAEANQELESFSYSVSHDLRAPLRHVHGYVELLQRATAGQLAEKARHYLETISAATAEMAVLIDDLLAFSRMGRAEMKMETVALDGLVQEVIRGLEMAVHGRRIEWQIAPLPEVLGDAAMLRQVLANLLGNAVKYSRPRDPAHIEIGCAGREDGRVVLFVRDDGVGFDMQYAQKLFGVFQRMHRTDEFEGTGIGLATVRRIIARHGGTVRAEAALDRGATFYFTLQPVTAV